jgi:hypothetical protein
MLLPVPRIGRDRWELDRAVGGKHLARLLGNTTPSPFGNLLRRFGLAQGDRHTALPSSGRRTATRRRPNCLGARLIRIENRWRIENR